jgi:hypothetical protein
MVTNGRRHSSTRALSRLARVTMENKSSRAHIYNHHVIAMWMELSSGAGEKVAAAAARWVKFIRQHLELTVAIIDGWVCLGVYHCYYANNSLITGTFIIIYRASAVSLVHIVIHRKIVEQ